MVGPKGLDPRCAIGTSAAAPSAQDPPNLRPYLRRRSAAASSTARRSITPFAGSGVRKGTDRGAFDRQPSVAKADKSGWEAVGRYIYAFYDTAKFTRFAVPDATSFKGCQQHHRFIGLCEDSRRAELEGPLRVAKGYCACDPCLLLQTDDCLLPQLVGKAVRAKAPLAKGGPMRVPQMLSLTQYAEWLEAKRLVAVNVDESELELEGPYWLALLSGDAFTIEEDMMYAGQQYRAGWVVAPGRWYKLRQNSERGYELLLVEARARPQRLAHLATPARAFPPTCAP